MLWSGWESSNGMGGVWDSGDRRSMAGLPVRSASRSNWPGRSACTVFAWCWIGWFTTLLGTAQPPSPPLPSSPAIEPATRLIPLYYVRDIERVIAMMRDPVPSGAAVPSSDPRQRMAAVVLRNRQLLAEREALQVRSQPAPEVIRKAIADMPLRPLAPDRRASERDLAAIDRELQWLAEEEEWLRAESFRQESEAPRSPRGLIMSPTGSADVIDQVRITVVGEGMLHLRGPLAGVNAITRMVHEIDQPVGQVKLGIHVVQFTGSDDAAVEGVNGAVDRYLSHARGLCRSAQMLFRTALGNVASRYHAANPDRFEQSFFYAPCVENFCTLQGTNSPLSLAMLDSRDIVTTLYLVGLANQEVRREVLTEFRRLAESELPRIHEDYQTRLVAPHAEEAGKAASRWAKLTKSAAATEAGANPSAVLDCRFAQTMAVLDSHGEQADSINPIQIATARFQRALLKYRQADQAVVAMRRDRLVLALGTSGGMVSPPIRTVSGGMIDADSFTRLADTVIEERASAALDLREVLRSEIAALDGQLKRLTMAFEADLKSQFYKPVIEDLRRNSGAWKSRMGQLQSTTILTPDRVRARVSPGQVAVLHRPVRPVLLHEGLQVTHGLVQEAQSLSMTAGMLAASEAAAPGSSLVLSQTGVLPTPGKHLEELTGHSERITLAVGDDIVVTPVIQPDGFSVAFHLLYTHTPRRSVAGNPAELAGVQRHLVEANVHIPSLELQEVSRFRVLLDNEERGPGIPLMEDIPKFGNLFRPRRAAASTAQENIILVEATVYPTAVGMAEKSWLTTDIGSDVGREGLMAVSWNDREPHSDLADWIAATLQQKARANLPDTRIPDSRLPQRLATPSGPTPPRPTLPASAKQPVTR